MVRRVSILTNTRYRTDSVYVVNASPCLNLNASNECFIRRPQIRRDVDAMGNGRKRGALPSNAPWRKFCVGNNSIGLFCSVYLRYDYTACDDVRAGKMLASCIAYCAPASKALLTRSTWVILSRTSGETPRAAIAAVALCMESSLMYPCSQSIMMAFSNCQRQVVNRYGPSGEGEISASSVGVV